MHWHARLSGSDEACDVVYRTSEGGQSSGVGALYVWSKQVCGCWKRSLIEWRVGGGRSVVGKLEGDGMVEVM